MTEHDVIALVIAALAAGLAVGVFFDFARGR